MNPILEGKQKAFVAGGSAASLQPLFMWLFTSVVGMPYEAAFAASTAASAIIGGLLTYLIPNS